MKKIYCIPEKRMPQEKEYSEDRKTNLLEIKKYDHNNERFKGSVQIKI